MDQSTQTRLEKQALQQVQQQLMDCLKVIENNVSAEKPFLPDIRRIDAMLLVCRKHIKQLGTGYTTTES